MNRSDSEVRNVLQHMPSPIIELAGPTPSGYFVLQEFDIPMPTDAVITNITNPVIYEPYGDNPQSFAVDRVVDITSLPFDDGSVGTVLVSSVPFFGTREGEFDDQLSAAKKEYEDYSPEQTIVSNLRIMCIREVARALRPEGLFIMQSIVDEDMAVAKTHGLNIIHTEPNGPSFVARKSG